ncbi:MAG: LysR substrate-binding domain-containing protein [Pseudomonadota bacterium]
MNDRLPPLNAVRVFSVVAQKLNFARAAEELGVTQSAVSKQILLLEDFIGTTLFERKAQGVALTIEGRELREAVLPAMDRLANSFERYARRPARSSTVRLTTTASFASLVLIPALGEFEKERTDIDIEILAGDRLFDLDREEVDFAIRFGPGPWPGMSDQLLGAQTLTPVASPTLLAQHDNNIEVLLRDARRVQVFAKNEWLDAGLDQAAENQQSRSNLVLENFHVAAHAVRLGQGIGLLPTVLLKDDFKRTALCQLADPIAWSEGFHFLAPSARPLSQPANAVADWVKALVQ